MQLPGDLLLKAVSEAKSRLLLVAPYMKVGALERILEAASPDLAELTCVTRWLPQDIAAGVCDLEIFDLLAGNPAHHLRVHPHLHAKYYRADDLCLVGSANLTDRGMGWAAISNLELLQPAHESDLRTLYVWEQRMLHATLAATQEMRDQLREAVAKLSSTPMPPPLPEVLGAGEEEEEGPSSLWVPSCTAPQRLWEVYSGTDLETMLTATLDAAQQDLAVLAPPPGLTEGQFNDYILGVLRGIPIFQDIEREIESTGGLSDLSAHDMIRESTDQDSPRPPDHVWRSLKAWFRHFFSHEYFLDIPEETLGQRRPPSSYR